MVISMSNCKNIQFGKNHGFAIGSILVAVILIAAITSAVAYASRGPTTDANRERNSLNASTLIHQATTIQSAIARRVAGGNNTAINSINDLVQEGYVSAGFGALYAGGLSQWYTNSEISSNQTYGPYLNFGNTLNNVFLVRLNADKDLCNAVMRNLVSSLSLRVSGSSDGNDSNVLNNGANLGGGNAACVYSMDGVLRCPDDPVVSISPDRSSLNMVSSNEVLGPTCVDLTQFTTDPSLGKYLIIAYIKG